MKTIFSTAPNNLARVFVGELQDGNKIEFVESVQPPFSREEKWVIIVSTLKGCPIECPICDAGGNYKGKLSTDEIISQIDYAVVQHYPNKQISAKKLKIQFARMGDPAFNINVIDVLEKLPALYNHKGLMPCVSTVAPKGTEEFFEKLIDVKNKYYGNGNFQMQFSIHSTNEEQRKVLVPASTWSLEEIAAYGERFFNKGDRKITLNFATPEGYELNPIKLASIFNPEKFLVKLTPVNPTRSSFNSDLKGIINVEQVERNQEIVKTFELCGFQTILSIGELEENQIGSNCGMYIN